MTPTCLYAILPCPIYRNIRKECAEQTSSRFYAKHVSFVANLKLKIQEVFNFYVLPDALAFNFRREKMKS
jgi:hypothetical protein